MVGIFININIIFFSNKNKIVYKITNKYELKTIVYEHDTSADIIEG